MLKIIHSARRSSLALFAFAMACLFVVVMFPRPAMGCSCAGFGDIAAAIDESPAAFVGTLVDRRDGGVGQFGSEAIFRFEVEEWVKADLGDVIDVHSAADGAACGLEFFGGERIGAFLYEENGHLTSSLCSQVDPDVLLAAARGPVVSETGIPRYLVGGWGSSGLQVLDSVGALVITLDSRSSPDDFVFTDPQNVSICPGEALLVQRTGQGLVFWDLLAMEKSGEIVDADLGQASITGVSCRDEEGAVIWAVVEGEGGTNLIEARTGDELMVLPGPMVSFGQTHIVTQNYESTVVDRVDVATGETVRLHETPPGVNWGVYGKANPFDGTTAVIETRYDESGVEATLFVYAADGTVADEYQIPYESYGPWWLDATRVALRASSFDNSNETFLYVFDTATDQLAEIPGWPGSEVAGEGGAVVGFQNGTLVRGDATSGSFLDVATIPSQDAVILGVLSAAEPVSTVTTESGGKVEAPPLGADGIEVLSGGSTFETQNEATNTARIALFALVGAALVASVATWMVRGRVGASSGQGDEVE